MLEFLICRESVFFVKTTLTAFNRNAKDLNGGPCQYKSDNGVLLES